MNNTSTFCRLLPMSEEEHRHLIVRYSCADSRFGKMVVASSDKGICYLAFGEKAEEDFHFRFPASLMQEEPVHRSLFQLVEQWGTVEPPPLTLHVYGTDFQLAVWQELLRIPPSATSTYKSIATLISRPKAVRAVGTAIGKNPIALLIPCHRVLSSSGSPGGYRWGIPLKQELLQLEASHT